MAVKKPINKKNQKKPANPKPIVIFWLLFVIIVAALYLKNSETIQKNFNFFKKQITANSNSPLPVEDVPLETELPIEIVDVRQTPQAPAEEPTSAIETPSRTEPKPETVEPLRPAEERPVPEKTPLSPQEPPQTPPEKTADRNIYFTQIDKDGHVSHSRVTRKIKVSDSPMTDALSVLLAGPSSAEINRGLLNLIPENTRILSAVVRGSTAYINFSEDFLFNTFGVEGYAAQLRQIVWTVTEFSNVRDVQILVEGRRLDYLGEGIWIGSPISRQSF